MRYSREAASQPEWYSAMEQAPAFFKVAVSAHPRRAVQKSREEAALALDMLRLFMGSFYQDTFARTSRPRRMGIWGTLPVTGAHGNVLFARADRPVEEQFPGSSVDLRYLGVFEISGTDVEALTSNPALMRINLLLRSLDTGSSTVIARRFKRVITWFGRASTAESMAESLLMYAISAESLLSEGRTPKETYAEGIAALTTHSGDCVVYPMGGCLSRGFATELSNAASRDDRFALVKDRVIQLFKLRNGVAHGRLQDHEIEAVDVLDLETLVRNAILSFACERWNMLEQFNAWLERNYPRKEVQRWRRCLTALRDHASSI